MASLARSQPCLLECPNATSWSVSLSVSLVCMPSLSIWSVCLKYHGAHSCALNWELVRHLILLIPNWEDVLQSGAYAVAVLQLISIIGFIYQGIQVKNGMVYFGIISSIITAAVVIALFVGLNKNRAALLLPELIYQVQALAAHYAVFASFSLARLSPQEKFHQFNQVNSL